MNEPKTNLEPESRYLGARWAASYRAARASAQKAARASHSEPLRCLCLALLEILDGSGQPPCRKCVRAMKSGHRMSSRRLIDCGKGRCRRYWHGLHSNLSSIVLPIVDVLDERRHNAEFNHLWVAVHNLELVMEECLIWEFEKAEQASQASGSAPAGSRP